MAVIVVEDVTLVVDASAVMVSVLVLVQKLADGVAVVAMALAKLVKAVQVAVTMIVEAIVNMDVKLLVTITVKKLVVPVRDVLLVQVAAGKIVPALVIPGVQAGVKEAAEIAVWDVAHLVKAVVLLAKEHAADAKILVKQNVQVDVL